MNNEEETVRQLSDAAHRRAIESMEAEAGNEAKEDDGFGEAAQPDSGEEEEVVVEDDVKQKQSVDETPKDTVVPVDMLMRSGSNKLLIECPSDHEA